MSYSFQHTKDTISPAASGEYSALNDVQNFAIVSLDHEDKKNFLKRTEAQATFKFLDYVISMSTSGLNHGACRSQVVVFDLIYEIVYLCDTVEEAILWCQQKNV